MSTSPKVLFEEKQRFSYWWMWICALFPLGLALYGCYTQLLVGEPFGNRPMSNTGLLIFTLFSLGFAVLFRMHLLTTKVTSQSLTVRFFPYVTKVVHWEDIERCEVIPYGFLGGWGIRLWTQYGTVYNVRSGKGLYVILKNKKQFLVGTQQPEALDACLKQLPISEDMIT